MNKKTAILAIPALCFAVSGLTRLSFGAFAAGDLAVFQATAASSNNTTASILDLSSTTANQTSPGSTAVDASYRFSGSATSTGYLSHTADGSLVTFTGAITSGNNSVNANTLTNRAVLSIDVSDAITQQTTYTGSSGNQTRSATSFDNSTWYIGDQGGVYSNGTIAASPAGNIRSVKPFGGQAIALSASSTVIALNAISAPTGGTLTALPGIPADSAAVDFYMVSSGQNGSVYDVLYILDSGNATTDKIDKFSLVSGNWTSNGNVSTGTAIAGFGLAAEETISGNVSLFLTTGNGATPNNSVIALTDTGGYNTAININLANDVTLYTATGNTTLKGIDFAPAVSTSAPEPTALGLVAVGALTLIGRRRK